MSIYRDEQKNAVNLKDYYLHPYLSFCKDETTDSDDKRHSLTTPRPKAITTQSAVFPTDPFTRGSASRKKAVQTNMLNISRIQRSPVFLAVPLPPGSIPSEVLISKELGPKRIYKSKVRQPHNSFDSSPASPNRDYIHQARTGEQVAMVWGETESVPIDKVNLKQFLKLNQKDVGREDRRKCRFGKDQRCQSESL